MPEQFGCFISGVETESPTRRCVQEIHDRAVVALIELVQEAANQEVEIQLPPESAKVAAGSSSAYAFRYAQSTAEPRDNTANRGHLHLSGCVADQIYMAVAHPPVNGRPSCVRRNASTLKLDGIQPSPFKERFQMPQGRGALLADQP
jgi:hypothetical protein